MAFTFSQNGESRALMSKISPLQIGIEYRNVMYEAYRFVAGKPTNKVRSTYWRTFS